MDIQFNINEYVSVKLTATSAEILNQKNKDSNERFQQLGIDLQCKTDYRAGDTFKDQFWGMFQLFGPRMKLGMEAPFHSGMITLHTT